MAPKQFEDVVDLTISDSDAETDLILTPATFRRPRSLEPLEPLLADFRPDNESIPARCALRPRIDSGMDTPEGNNIPQALPTPPTTQKTSDAAAQRGKRRRSRSETPSPRETKKRAGGQVGVIATPSTSVETTQVQPTTPHISQRAQNPPTTPPSRGTRVSAVPTVQPTPVAGRFQHRDGHVAVDPSVFSPKPFIWEPWSEKDYLFFSEAVVESFDSTQFAKDLSSRPGHRIVPTEEVSYMLRAAVARPLRLLKAARQCGEQGMKEIAAYFQEHGTEIRWWGSGRVIRGVFRGLEERGIVLALATTPFGKVEQDAKRAAGIDLVIDAQRREANISLRLLCEDDIDYLQSIFSENDAEVFDEWMQELAAEPAAVEPRRKDKGRASSVF